MTTKKILNAIRGMKFENTFNPYFERCDCNDSNEAPKLRRNNLENMLEKAATANLDAIWVGRDLGYRGGRRTGLALTDDVHFSDHLERWGLPSKRPNSSEPVAERTASVIWNILLKVNEPVFLWNVFPLHPFKEGDPFSNRAHNARERAAGAGVLELIIKYIKPRRKIAIGNDAFTVLTTVFGTDSVYKVRHPSYGGQSEFLHKMQELYRDCVEEPAPGLFSTEEIDKIETVQPRHKAAARIPTVRGSRISY